MTTIVNLYAGPGCGKSTAAAGIFYELKKQGMSCELVTEYAKDKVWEESFGTLSNQIYVFGKQHHRTHRCLNKVDVIITDSPLLLSLIYGAGMSEQFKNLVLHEHRKLDTINILIDRAFDYDPTGRTQTEEEAHQVDADIKAVLKTNMIPHYTTTKSDDVVSYVMDILEKLHAS